MGIPLININNFIDEAKCYETIRELRWSGNVYCPHCVSHDVIKNGHNDKHPECQRYICKKCNLNFDDLTKTVFAKRHQPLSKWMLCLYFMGLNISNRQIARELDINVSDCQKMTTALREAVSNKNPEVLLKGEVECDEVYVVAGHKGHPEVVKKKGRKGRRNRLKGARGRGTAEREKPPIFGMIQRSGHAVIQMLDNVQQKTIKPIIDKVICKSSTVFTDEYNIYAKLDEWGYSHKTVCHSAGEYARDEDGDGFFEVHVNTMEGFWSLLRSWLRPHRGISQEALPHYLGFFQFIHNTRSRGKGLLMSLLGLLVL